MTHIDTYSHRIPHKYTQIHTFYTHLHTNCHIFGWVTKNHTYIYISIYIYNKINTSSYKHSTQQHIILSTTSNHKEKKFFNQKQNKQMKIKIKSFIQS